MRRTVTVLAAALAVVLAGVAPAGGVADGEVLAAPDLATHPQGDNSYPRLIRLEHDGAGGSTLLATYAKRFQGATNTLPVLRSTDDGASWTQISEIASNTPGWDIEAPVLYEVPHTAGGLTAGDLLAAGTAWNVGDFTAQKVEVFRSTDHGATWSYLSECTSTSGLPNTIGHGIWEPWFHQAADGRLACFISDERPAGTPTNNQVIGHYLSTDGGASWGSTLVQDIAFPADDLARPGMSILTELPTGDVLMTYELCRDATDADHACEVYVKTSPDGFDWSPADDPGTLVQTDDGRMLLHTPYVAWTPAGGPNGTLVLSGQRIGTGTTGNLTVQPESGRALFTNTNLGAGPWNELVAPLTIDPTGGYDPGEPSCPGYSSPIVPSADGQRLFYVAGTWTGTGNQCEIRFASSSAGTLPFTPDLVAGTKAGFAEYGGSWTTGAGTLAVTDTVPGSKALFGSDAWADYTVTGEVRLDAAGQAGLLLRANDPAVGADAGRGYYVGLESATGELVLGELDNGWTGISVTPVSGGVAVGTWYRITATATGCDLTVTAEPADGSGTPATASATVPGCFATGAIGVRSHVTPATWRALSVT